MLNDSYSIEFMRYIVRPPANFVSSIRSSVFFFRITNATTERRLDTRSGDRKYVYILMCKCEFELEFALLYLRKRTYVFVDCTHSIE